jgi:outer membrane protein OmpA-like peptidoglycan-associated protein
MADITLAEFNGRVFLIGGEAHLDDLLANPLGAEVSIELVQCERQSEVHALWVQHGGEQQVGTGGLPWTIHPNIANRIRRRSPDYAVYFAQWSAMLDADALTVIDAAAAWAELNPEAPVQIAEYVDEAGPAAIAALAGVRVQLVEDRLAERGIARARISRTRRSIAEVPGMTQESQRVDIVVRAT